MKFFEFTTIRKRLTFWLFTMSILPLFITFITIYNQRVTVLKEDVFHKLQAIRDLKVREVNNWLDEKIGDTKTISGAPEIRSAEELFIHRGTGQDAEEQIKRILYVLNRYMKHYDDFYEIFIIDAHSGKLVISTDTANEGKDFSEDELFTEALRNRTFHLTDIHYSETLKEVTMTLSDPIFSIAEQDRIIGMLVVRIDLRRALYDLLLNRTGMGYSGETLIVNKDVIALNELRWYDNAPLRLQIDAEPAVRAARGETGIIETGDYRGEKVLAAYTHIERTGWGFVAKQDLQEVYASIRQLLLNMILLFIASLIAVLVAIVLLSQSISKPLVEMTQVSRKIQAGDYSVRNTLNGKDEIAFLARSFNRMADTMLSQLEVQEKSRELIKTMVACRDLQDFREQVTQKLVELSASNIGSYFAWDEQSRSFRHSFSIGASVEQLKGFDAESLEGGFGQAIATKKICYLKEIPEDTPFSFKTILGAALPREIVTIPILLDDSVRALLGLAGIKGYTQEETEVIEQNWAGINTAFSNFMANEKVKNLVGDLEQNRQELELQAKELKHQSGVLQQQNVDLEIKSQQVEEASRLKSEFLSNMSHELRTPLNSVIALSRVLMMQTKNTLTEEEFGYLEIIARNGKHLLTLINDILDISKIEAGKAEIALQHVSLRDVIGSVAESLEPLAREKGLSISLDVPKTLPELRSDETKVRQILHNIVGNAVKFTRQGQVSIQARLQDEKCYIQVKDTGIGIPRDALPTIFEEFRQVDGSASREYEGTGLGLSIALKSARLLGGTILAESMLGQGSTFTIVLPADLDNASRTPSPEIARERSFFPLSPKDTVLIIDDDPQILVVLAEFLREAGYHTITASSGEKALELAKQHHPFAITLDLMMPEMDGWETLQAFKTTAETADIPVIIVSVADDRDTALALGAIGYVSKPLQKDRLVAEIHKVSHTPPALVMVVDDNVIDRQEEVRIIEEDGMKAIMAYSGFQCLDLLQEQRPDAIVLDLMMPGMDGFEVLEKIRQDSHIRDIPVIVVTAKDLSAQEKQHLNQGASAVLAKSRMSPEQLLYELQDLLAKVRRSRMTQQERIVLQGYHLLLVEDSEPAVVQIKHALEQSDARVDVARNGQEALDYLHHQIPDGIILDLMMPGIDGFEVLENLRTHESSAAIPVLVLTAKDLTHKDLDRLSTGTIQQLVQKGDIDHNQLLFKVKLMLAKSPEMHVRPEASLLSELERNSPVSPKARKDLPAKGESFPERSSPRLLLIEDNPDNRATIRAMLQDSYDILEAEDGEKGLDLAQQQAPDLILLDMSLPKMDGFEVVSRLKQHTTLRAIPVVALTAHAMKGDRENILSAGCDEYLSKPIEPETLSACIEKWLQKEE